MINKELPRIFAVPLGGSVRASPTVHKAFHRLVLEHYSWAKQPTAAWGNGKNVPMCVTPYHTTVGVDQNPLETNNVGPTWTIVLLVKLLFAHLWTLLYVAGIFTNVNPRLKTYPDY